MTSAKRSSTEYVAYCETIVGLRQRPALRGLFKFIATRLISGVK